MGHHHSSMSGFGFSLEDSEEDDNFEELQEAGEKVGIFVELCGDMVVGPTRIFVTLADTFTEDSKIKVREVRPEEIDALKKFAVDHNLTPDEEIGWITESYFG